VSDRLEDLNVPQRLLSAIRHEVRTTTEQQLNDLWMVVHSIKDNRGAEPSVDSGGLVQIQGDLDLLNGQVRDVSQKVDTLAKETSAADEGLQKRIRGVRKQLSQQVAIETPPGQEVGRLKQGLERLNEQQNALDRTFAALESRLLGLEAQLLHRLEQLEERPVGALAPSEPWRDEAVASIPASVQFGLDDLAKVVLKYNAFELHVKSDSMPYTLINEELIPIGKVSLGELDSRKIVLQVLSVDQRRHLLERKSCECLINLQQHRFRLRAFFERSRMCATLRRLPSAIPSMEELGLPRAIELSALESSGLTLVAGGPQSGRTTTLAALADHINHQRRVRIFSLEEAIEYELVDADSLIVQQEVGADIVSLREGLENLRHLRPQVVLVSSIPNCEVARQLLRLASAGTLVLAGCEGQGAANALDLFVDLFPNAERATVANRLAQVLRAVLAQRLLPSKDQEKPCLCSELLLNTKSTVDFIREGHFRLVDPTLDRGVEGMQSFRLSAAELQRQGRVDAPSGQAPSASGRNLGRKLQESQAVELGPPPESAPSPPSSSRPEEPSDLVESIAADPDPVVTRPDRPATGDDDTLLGWL
jgi:twitching motility protein PilT